VYRESCRRRIRLHTRTLQKRKLLSIEYTAALSFIVTHTRSSTTMIPDHREYVNCREELCSKVLIKLGEKVCWIQMGLIFASGSLSFRSLPKDKIYLCQKSRVRHHHLLLKKDSKLAFSTHRHKYTERRYLSLH